MPTTIFHCLQQQGKQIIFGCIFPPSVSVTKSINGICQEQQFYYYPPVLLGHFSWDKSQSHTHTLMCIFTEGTKK